ncbi:MAG TPA: PIG-L family deacetylase [Ferruginibacter sp.]|nr:PIG-L family deacetylase [Ferruginibacter sp.]
MKKYIAFCLSLLLLNIAFAQNNPVKVLVVVAHPDDEAAMSVTIYKITHQLGGIVDEAVITNGEAGYKYSLLAESIYNLKLTDEKVGRENLPRIRKQELINAGKIIGIRNFYFFDQKDAHYGLDEHEPLDTSWDVSWVLQRLNTIMTTNKYDYVFCLLPEPGTHGGHKAATLLALQTVMALTIPKPVILSVSGSSKTDTTQKTFTQLKDYTYTKISIGKSSFLTDKTIPFGYNNKLNYKIIVNWEIAEHKSQGTMQTFMNMGDYENYWYYDINDPAQFDKTKMFFDHLNSLIPE